MTTDYIGTIAVPQATPIGTFPIVSDFGYGLSHQPKVAIHQFGSANAKIEQRFLLENGARHFTVRRSRMRESDRQALRNFWENSYGPYGAFAYNAPNDDGHGATPTVCRFENEPLSWEFLSDAISSVGVTLVEIPSSASTYALNSEVTRFPSDALKTALLDQVQTIIPLICIQPLQSGYPAIYVSDRRCTIGSQLYLPRLLEFDGISQGIGNESDQAQFSFGNADRVMTALVNAVDLFRASISFSLFHVDSGIQIDLWKGEIVDWTLDSGPAFQVTAADGMYELNLPYPTRKISRTCWKCFSDGLNCPFSTKSTGMDTIHFPTGDPTQCDKSYDGPNGCLAHGMKHYFGGIIAEPQGVSIKDNSTGFMGFGRSTITATSIVNDSVYDQVIPEIYTDNEEWTDSNGNIRSGMPVNCKICEGRDESDFYEALGIVGEGPLTLGPLVENIGGVNTSQYQLDGQYNHGFPGTYGFRPYNGTDPAGEYDFFSLDAGVNPWGQLPDWRVVSYLLSVYKDNFAAGTSFVVIRRKDQSGIQLSTPDQHQMQANVLIGLTGWVWSAPGERGYGMLTNPIWIVINMMLKALGLRNADAGTAEQYFDVNAAIAAAAVCQNAVTPLIGTATTETQFQFRGILQDQKPLRDWIQEVLMNCLGYYSFEFGKLKLGIRDNSSAIESFTIGNILFKSLSLSPNKPAFNHLTANFADREFAFAANNVVIYDQDNATLMGNASGPLFTKSEMNLAGTCTKSQAARIITTRLREELGGINAAQWTAARRLSFKTTILSLNVEPGMVCSMTHPDMPAGVCNGVPTPNYGEFRVQSWKLNKDYSIEIQGRTTVDEMYDFTVGPKPADVIAGPVPTEPPLTSGVPEELWTAGLISSGRIIFGCMAEKWGATIDQAEFRATLVPAGQSVNSVDLRTVEEGGTFAANGTTNLIVAGLFANWEGVHYQVFYGSNTGRWYFAFRLHNTTGGWSVWSDGNNAPQFVTDYVDTDGDSFSDTGPPADWTVGIQPGPQSGTAIAVASRPAANGKRLWFGCFQVKDSTTGNWRAVDANAGAAVTRYDGSAIDHTYDPEAGTITKASGDFGDAATYGGLMIVDVRQGEFDAKYTRWGAISPAQIGGAVIGGCIGLDPAFAPGIDGKYTGLRLKIVRPPWEWDTEGYFAQAGYQAKEYWDNATRGDLDSPAFKSDPFVIPAGVGFADLQARVWFGTDYSFSDDGIYSPSPSSNAPSTPTYVTYLADAATVDIDCGLGPLFYLLLTGDHALGSFTNMRDGQIIGLILQQDSVGNRHFALGSGVRFGSTIQASDYVLSTAAGARDYLILIYDGQDGIFDAVSYTAGYAP